MINCLYHFSLLCILMSGICSCKILTIERSPIRQAPSPEFSYKGVTVTTTGIVYVNFAELEKGNLVPPGFMITDGVTVVYIDPLLVDNGPKANYIFITHPHDDHFSVEDIAKLSKEPTIIIAPVQVTQKLNNYHTRAVLPGDIHDFGLLSYETVPAYNLPKGMFKPVLHSKNAGYAGYVLTLSGVRIYHAGDTDLIPEMIGLKDIDIALLPIGIGDTAMTPRAAAEAVSIIRPDIVVPMHYDPETDALDAFRKLVPDSVRIEPLR